MSWIDDLKVRAAQVTGEVKKYADITTYIKDQVTAVTVKVGQPATGNLSEAELQAGARGGTKGVPVNTQNASTLMNANPMLLLKDNANMILPLIAIAGVAFLIFKRK